MNFISTIYKWIKIIFFTTSRQHSEIIEINKSFSYVRDHFINFFENEKFIIKGYHFSSSKSSFSIEDDWAYKPFPIKELSQYFISYQVDEVEYCNSISVTISLRFTQMAQTIFRLFKSFTFFSFLLSLLIWLINFFASVISPDVMFLLVLVPFVLVLIVLSISFGDYFRIDNGKKRLLRAIKVFESGKELHYF